MAEPFKREVVKRKWSADKSAGPLVLLAEWVQKRLIQHAYPCEYVVEWSQPLVGPEENQEVERYARAVQFRAMRGRQPLAEEFWSAFDSVLRIVAHEKRVAAYRHGASLWLDGPHYVDKYGKIRRGNPPAPF